MHFGKVKELLEAHRYPEAPANIGVHGLHKQQVDRPRVEFQSSQTIMILNVTASLKSWVSDHIKGIDKKYHLPLKQKEVS